MTRDHDEVAHRAGAVRVIDEHRVAARHAVSGEPDIPQPAQRWLPNCGATSWHNRHARTAIRSSRASQPGQSTAAGSVGVPQPPQAGGSTNSSEPLESSASLRKASAPILVGHTALCSPGPSGVSCIYDRAKKSPWRSGVVNDQGLTGHLLGWRQPHEVEDGRSDIRQAAIAQAVAYGVRGNPE